MKKRIFISTVVVSLLVTSISGILLSINKDKTTDSEVIATPTYASSLPKTIYLKDNTSEEIKDYYDSLTSLGSEEKCGTNLLKNLRTILHNNLTYYKYGSIGDTSGVTIAYTITDRDWEHSPASTITGGTYDAENNVITNFRHATEKDNDPYIKMLYVDYSIEDTTKFLSGTNANFDKEHVWSQSHGFKKEGSGAEGPAGTDLHHLIAGEKEVNQHYHSNYSYGYVKTPTDEATSETISPQSGLHITGNKVGYAEKTSPNDESNIVFEPNDADKGRIARALLYMAACYNNYSGEETISQYDPNLELVDYIIEGDVSVGSNETTTAKYGILSDLLDWNRRFQPDEFEIHRNNLIYNNYQFNRNPFIDYPEWADYIWGNEESSYTPTGYVDLDKDVINGYRERTVELTDEGSINASSGAFDGWDSYNTGSAYADGAAKLEKTGSYVQNTSLFSGDVANNMTQLEVTINGKLNGTDNASNSYIIEALDSEGNVLASDSYAGLIGTSYADKTFTITGNLTGCVGFRVKYTNKASGNWGVKSISWVATYKGSPTPTSITATVHKNFKVGDVISKADITVKDNLNNLITDYEFTNHQFTYSEASSGGALTNKSFDISYGDLETTLNVNVYREGYVTPGNNEYSEDDFSSCTGTSGTPVDYPFSLSGISCKSTRSYLYNDYLSFKTDYDTESGKYKTTSELYNTEPFPTSIVSASLTLANAPTANYIVKYSNNGTNNWLDTPSDDSYYFKIYYSASETFTGYINISSVNVLTKGEETALNVANYIMYEDTNGQCTTKLDIALGYFTDMSVLQRKSFMEDDNYVLNLARARLIDWAKSKNKTISYVNGDYVVNSSTNNASLLKNNNNVMIIIVLTSICVLTLLSYGVLIYKKHH